MPRHRPVTEYPILVPRRADHGARDRIWDRLRETYWADCQVVEGHHDEPGPFNRSAALNLATDLAGDWEYAVIADADSIVLPGQLSAAIDLAKTTDRLVIAHSLWVNVEPDETDQFLDTLALRWRDGRHVVDLGVSSMLVVPRTTWDTVGGFDERFEGWGCEDRAFARACRILDGPPERMHGTVWHLAHDRPAADTHRMGDHLFRANQQLLTQYKRAKTPEDMRALRPLPIAA